MQRILLLMDHKENARLLAERLAERYTVEIADGQHALGRPFDLCILDGPALDRGWPKIEARKQAEGPLFLPFLLVGSRQDATLGPRQLWQYVDEFIAQPVERIEIQARVEILLRARRQSLELKRRNDDLEALAQALGHDLRAPVRIAGRFASALLENPHEPLGEDNRRYAARIRTAADDMETLIAALLALCRLGRGDVRLRPLPVRAVVDDALNSLEPDIRASGGRVEVAGELPVVMADTVLLKMVLTNLIGNALKFVAPGAAPAISVYASQAGGQCRVCVRDNGVGIPGEDQGRIFNPFVRLYGEEDYAGVGLGLPTVRKAVELMGGRVGVESAEGAGSTFWAELDSADGGAGPAVSAAAADAAPADATGNKGSGVGG